MKYDPYHNATDAETEAESWKKEMNKRNSSVGYQTAKRLYEYYKNLADFLRNRSSDVDSQSGS